MNFGCAAISRSGRPDAARSGEPPEIAPARLVLRERVLYEVVALSCITETLSAALLGAARQAGVIRFSLQIMPGEKLGVADGIFSVNPAQQ